MENVRKRVDIKLITQWDGRYGMQEMIAKPNFKRSVIFNQNLVACELSRLNIIMNKPMIVGCSILELSKTLMYKFHYDFMLKHFNSDNCTILYTDTDSFMYEIVDSDIYAFIRDHPDKFDTSEFDPKNPYNIVQYNKKVIGVMKDENNGKLVEEYVGIRSKLYTYKMHKKRGQKEKERKIIKKAKGVKTNILNKKISFNDYKRCIDKLCVLKREQTTIKSHLHNVYTMKNEKKALDPFDDKRRIIPGSYKTLALGHYKIKRL